MRDLLGMHPLIAQAQFVALAAHRLKAAEARRIVAAARAADRRVATDPRRTP